MDKRGRAGGGAGFVCRRIAAALTAAGLAPSNILESGIAATLPPGLYTALLVGLNNATGIGPVEVYDLGP